MSIKCCKGCVTPNRYPGCHSHCPLYRQEKAEYQAKKESEDSKRDVINGINYQRSKAVHRAMKGKRPYKCG